MISLYPPEHWHHNPELFDEKLSKEFEKDGYLWTASGAAVNPKIYSLQQLEIERLRKENRAKQEQARLEKQKAREQRILEKEGPGTNENPTGRAPKGTGETKRA